MLTPFKVSKCTSHLTIEECFLFLDAKFRSPELRDSPRTSALNRGIRCRHPKFDQQNNVQANSESVQCKFNHYDIIGPKVMEFGEIMQNNGDFAVQDISRITILVPMGSLCATSYVSIIVTCLVSCTISEIWWNICPIFAVDRGCLSFTHWLRGEPLHSSQNLLETTKKLETSLYHMV